MIALRFAANNLESRNLCAGFFRFLRIHIDKSPGKLPGGFSVARRKEKKARAFITNLLIL